MQHRNAWLVLLCGVLLAVRFAWLQTYPQLGVDEGLWTLQAKDAVLFGDGSMNGLHQAYLSPLHFGITWLLLHILPATLFSVRILSAAFGVVTLGLVWKTLGDRVGPVYAWAGVAVIGLSLAMTAINRRAFLESGLMFFSTLAFYQSTKTGVRRAVGLTLSVAAVLLYKLNGVYLLPVLLLPVEGRESARDNVTRFLAVSAGVVIALGTFCVLYMRDRVGFTEAWVWEFTRATDGGLHVGRIGIFPGDVLGSIKEIATGVPDLGILSLTSLIAFAALPMVRDRFAWKVVLWLAGGYMWLFLQGRPHPQWFFPLVLPAGILGVQVMSRLKSHTAAARIGWILAAMVVLMSVGRVAWGVRAAAMGNPPMSALRWLESEGHAGGSCLATAEIAAATQRKCYAFNRIFHPYPGHTPPTLTRFVQDRRIELIVFDDWETAPFFANEPQFMAELARFRVAGRGDGWVGVATDVATLQQQ